MLDCSDFLSVNKHSVILKQKMNPIGTQTVTLCFLPSSSGDTVCISAGITPLTRPWEPQQSFTVGGGVSSEFQVCH